jgi:hypothetical protein
MSTRPLPDRTNTAEDTFVRDWSESDDSTALEGVIEEAMAARRPRLAARLVGLLDGHYEIEPGSALDRARKAARLVLTNKARPEDNSWSEFEDAWTDVRRGRMNRIRRRQRRSLTGKEPKRIGRLDRGRGRK